MHRFIAVVMLSVLFDRPLFAQGDTPPLPTLLSPMAVSPNSASLGKFGEIPVGYFTGIPTINIPIYEINSGGLKVPITLDYHAGGVKVEDIASWVGLGWALNAGGVITRQVRGVPDDSGPFNFLLTHDSITKYINGTMQDPLTYCENITRGMMDSERDLFFYNFGSDAGKFIFDSLGGCVPMTTSRIKIEFGSFLGKDNVFKITDLHGNQYFFTDKETTTYGFSTNNSYSQSAYDATSSWYLTQINNLLNSDSITFSYGGVINNITTLGTQTKYWGQGCVINQPNFIATGSNVVHGRVLTAIHFKNGTITFNASTQNRCDIISDRSLSSIVIQNTDNSFYKKYTFHQSFISQSSLPTTTCDPSHPENARLFLDSLSFSDTANVIGKYKFNYLSRDVLPSRFSFSQDMWGYYNGVPNTSMIPTVFMPGGVLLTGANRDPNFAYMQAGTLNSIVYPTGGSTEFQYEPNAVNNLSTDQSTTVANHQFIFSISDPTPRLIDTTFVINDDNGGGGVTMTWTYSPINGCSGALRVGCPVTKLVDGSGNILAISGNSSQFVNKGTFHIKLDLRGLDDNITNADLSAYSLVLSWKTLAVSVDSLRYNAPVGGLRVKQITNYTAPNSIATVKKYTYLMPDSAYYSSGRLLSYPIYFGMVGFVDVHDGGINCSATTITSTSNATMATDRSSYVTYKYVQEFLGTNGEFGKNQYQFNSADQFQDIVYTTPPFAPSISRDWERGQLIREKNFRYAGSSSGYQLVKESIHQYQNNLTNVYNNLKVAYGLIVASTTWVTGDLSNYPRSPYYLEAGWTPLMTDTIRTYDLSDLTKYNETVTTYTYSNTHYQPVTVTTTNSKGEVVVTQNKYPLDYPGLTATDNFTAGILNLQNKNVITPVIEKYTQRQRADGSNNRTLNGIVTSYRPDRALPDTIWATEFAAPSTNFTPSSVSGGRIIKSGAYQSQIEMLRYDTTGNIVEQRKKTDVRHNYIWDYQSSYPVAEVVNADSASIAYTSFEAENSGNWIVGAGAIDSLRGITGRKSYVLSGGGTISKSGLSLARTYIVSYWTQNAFSFTVAGTISSYPMKGKTVNGWTLYVHKVTGQSNIVIQGSGHIDELRLYPAEAQMTTYTFEPLVGMTSACDVGNRITYYEYDGIQRLKRIRDQDYNIIKSIDYQYQAATGCGNTCFIMTMQTLAGTNTLGYPVGVFDVNGKLIGNAAGPSQYVTLWNSDTADHRVGTLAVGGDSLHFNMTLNSGQALPSGVTGCRYYQFDLAWNNIDAIRNHNGAYVDFGDGIGMKLSSVYTVAAPVPANTTANMIYDGEELTTAPYYVHTYPDSSLKTITIYHNDDVLHDHIDNMDGPATSLTKMQHFRGNLPQNLYLFGGSCYQTASMNSIDSIYNWSSIHNITYLNFNNGDGANPFKHMNYAQDFMQYNSRLETIHTARGYYQSGYRDTTFRLSRLKSDWNTYFTRLQFLFINDDHWNREDLSALHQLSFFILYATTQNHQDDPSSPLIPLPVSEIDAIFNQIANGAGQTVSNGYIFLFSGGSNRSATSDAAVRQLLSKGWVLYVNGSYLTNP
jgi:hypothetical protein